MENRFHVFPQGVQDAICALDAHTMDDLSHDWTEAVDFYTRNRAAAKHMFGFPANPINLSPRTMSLLVMHYASPFSNNCGDIDESASNNYAMDSKKVEKQIVALFAEKFGLGSSFWGYVTGGGSESNMCGIELAFSKYPNGMLYYSEAAHYSIVKYAKHHPHVAVRANDDDTVNLDALFEAVRDNYAKTRAPANLVLTHGTTKLGACDDVDAIVAFLRAEGIPYYIHLDAALFGGIPNNQLDAPLILNAKARGIDSVCVSMHKYIGFPDVKSVFVSTSRPRGTSVQYIGQDDTTVSGSRSMPAYALYNHLREQLFGADPNDYRKNIGFFEALLEEYGIPFRREPLSNIFLIDRPSPSVYRKFQLSCFEQACEGVMQPKAHVIVFPSHEETDLRELALALRDDR